MAIAYKSIIKIVLASLLVSLMSISIVKAQGAPYTFTETWNYDGIHPEVNTGDSWEFTDLYGGGVYYRIFSITNQDLFADHHHSWSTYAGLYNYGPAYNIGPYNPPGDHGAATYTFSQSSGNVSVNATAHAHIVPQGETIFWPHFNVAQFQHTLDLVGGCGSFGNKVTIKLENASAEGSGIYSVLLGMKCTFYVKTLISRNPDTYSVEYKSNDIGLVTKSMWIGNWWDHCPAFSSGEYGLVDLWNSIYGYNYSTIPPTEIGQKYVSNVGIGTLYIQTWTESETLRSWESVLDSWASVGMNIGKITIQEIQPPVVFTSPASDVTKTSAILNGSVTDDGGEACQYRFRYKEAEGDYIYTSWAGSVTSGQSFSEAVGDLRRRATYYFNAQAKNSVGESDWGDEQSFVTRPIEFEISRARMVSPCELGIDIKVKFPKHAPEETPRKVDFWANVNGMDVFETCDITALVGPGETASIRFDDPQRSVGPHRVINFENKGVPRFDDNVSFTLYGKAYWEGGPYSDVNTMPVEIPLPVIIIHGYLYTQEAGGWFLEKVADFAYKGLREFLTNKGYTTDGSWYRTMWMLPDIEYKADKVDVLEMYFKVHSWIRAALQATYANKVNLIGHSTGGLVARYYSGTSSTVNKVISIGTPHLGLTRFYQYAFDKRSKEQADKIFRVNPRDPTSEENLLRWFEPEYGESCLVDATTGDAVPEPYQNTFNPAYNGNVHYCSIYANNHADTPFKLLVNKKKNGWYEIVGETTWGPGDGTVLELSASAFSPDPTPITSGVHQFLCDEYEVKKRVFEILSDR
jgi:pimeloyl-ACP methyl ester carboxylesterase